MINGFTNETDELTDKELSLVPGFVQHMAFHVGKAKAITNNQIIAAYKNAGVTITAPRIRKIINHVRLHHLISNLIATSDGYYIAESPEEIRVYVDSLKQRAGAIMAVANSYRI